MVPALNQSDDLKGLTMFLGFLFTSAVLAAVFVAVCFLLCLAVLNRRKIKRLEAAKEKKPSPLHFTSAAGIGFLVVVAVAVGWAYVKFSA
ncbi:hypothetical protein OAU50_02145 [Planctomycetota bacterium]|nr:hypothetical protein [Planctomycetota bacterium]